MKKLLPVLLSLAAVVALLIAVTQALGKPPEKSDPDAVLATASTEPAKHSGVIVPMASPKDAASTEAPAATPEPTPEPTPTSTPTIAAVLISESGLYSAPGDSDFIAFLQGGTEVQVEETEDPLWYRVATESLPLPETPSAPYGYLYAEKLYRMTETGPVGTTEGTSIYAYTGTSLYGEYLSRKLSELAETFPAGKYWNHMDRDDVEYGEETPLSVTDTPCENYVYGETYCNWYSGATGTLFDSTPTQCLGFASYLSDQIFGVDAPIHAFYDCRALRVGDHIRYDAYEHSATVTGVYDGYVTVAEVNRDYEHCLIEWGRSLSFDELESYSWDLTFYSRYPFRSDGAGGFSSWED